MSVARALRGRVVRLCGESCRLAGARAAAAAGLHSGVACRRPADSEGGAGDGEPPQRAGSQSFWGNKPKTMTKAEFARRVAQLLREEPRKTRDVWGERPMAMSKEEFRKRLYLWREGKLPPPEAQQVAARHRAEAAQLRAAKAEGQPREPPQQPAEAREVAPRRKAEAAEAAEVRAAKAEAEAQEREQPAEAREVAARRKAEAAEEAEVRAAKAEAEVEEPQREPAEAQEVAARLKTEAAAAPEAVEVRAAKAEAEAEGEQREPPETPPREPAQPAREDKKPQE